MKRLQRGDPDAYILRRRLLTCFADAPTRVRTQCVQRAIVNCLLYLLMAQVKIIVESLSMSVRKDNRKLCSGCETSIASLIS